MKLLLLVLASVLCSQHAYSWDAKDLGEEAASPWTTKARPVLIGGAALTLLSLVIEDRTDRYQDEVVEDRPLGTFSEIGDFAGQWIPNMSYVLGQYISGSTGDKKGHERAMGMLKATLYASSVTTAMKYTIREPRPNNHNDRNSFPSGHSTTAFAFSGYVLAEHGWGWGVPALLLSSFTAVSRINDNMHRLQDVFAGATIGLSYGMGISYLQKKNSTQTTSFQLVPIYEADVKGVAFLKSF